MSEARGSGSDLADALDGAADDAVLRPPSSSMVACVLPTVSPLIAIARPAIVLIKKPYQPRGNLLKVRLGTTSGFTGTGTLSCNLPGQVKVFNDKGVEQPMPWGNIPGAALSRGLKVQVEGVTPSANMDGTILSLALTGGNKAIINSPATDSMTCVEVTLDLGQYKPTSGGGDPPVVADKIGVGRNLHLQTPDFWAGRALLIVRQALPADYTGSVVLKARDARVRTFAHADEVAAPLHVAQPGTLTRLNANVAAGLKLWVEGAAVSRAMLDTGFTLGISHLPNVEGDRVNLTVVKAVFDIHDRRPKPGKDPPRLAAGARMNPGRSLHLQDGGTHHGRAKLLVKRVEPASWTGDLEVQVWDVTADSAANPRVSVFTQEPAASPAHANPIAHPAGVPSSGLTLWAEGSLTSAAMRDTQLRLRVTDAEGSADRAAVTVHECFVREITFNSIVPIYYARVPTAGSYILPPAADAPAKHFTPVRRRPAVGAPHWRQSASRNPAAAFSWPAVYVRRGAPGAPDPTFKVKFELFPKPGDNITTKISAEVTGTPIVTDEQDVTFNNGDSPDITFTIKKLDKTVRLLDGIEFQWKFDGFGPRTKHTLFVVDKTPRAANNLYVDEHLWEIFEWSCLWADGAKKQDPVFAAIWGRFAPAAAAHATGLVYWKNHNIGIAPAQDLATAVQSQDDLNLLQANAASCIVFDRVLINCCAAHGIHAAEIMLTPQTALFTRTAVQYSCTGWQDTTVNGQGNPAAPPSWGSHWIATVKLGSWKFFDASYGDGPTNAPTPGAASAAIDVFDFEPRTVQNFECDPVLPPGPPVLLPRVANRATPPHLVGEVLWTNR